MYMQFQLCQCIEQPQNKVVEYIYNVLLLLFCTLQLSASWLMECMQGLHVTINDTIHIYIYIIVTEYWRSQDAEKNQSTYMLMPR